MRRALALSLIIASVTATDSDAAPTVSPRPTPSLAKTLLAPPPIGKIKEPPQINLGCIPLKQVKNTDTPPDLFKASSVCFQKINRPQDGIALYAIAGAYGYFDKLRVTDPAARETIATLRMSSMAGLSPDKKEKLPEYFKPLSDPDSADNIAICKAAIKLGPPNYMPAYMTERLTVNPAPDAPPVIAPDFDKKKAWADTLKKYLHCS